MIAALFLLALVSCQTSPARAPLRLAPSYMESAKEAFLPHENWVGEAVPAAPIQGLLQDLQARLGHKLQARGEAHITVVTPPEAAVLGTHLSMAEINAAMKAFPLQSAVYQAVCLGTGSALVDGKREETYFIVLHAPEVEKARERIATLFQARGGDARAFVANHFYPHITVGFTKTDLYEAQGVVKDERSCLYPLDVR